MRYLHSKRLSLIFVLYYFAKCNNIKKFLISSLFCGKSQTNLVSEQKPDLSELHRNVYPYSAKLLSSIKSHIRSFQPNFMLNFSRLLNRSFYNYIQDFALE